MFTLENNRMASFNECTIRMKAKKMAVLLTYSCFPFEKIEKSMINRKINGTRKNVRGFNISKIGYTKF